MCANALFIFSQCEQIIQCLTFSIKKCVLLDATVYDCFPGFNLPLCLQWDSES